MDKSAEGGLRPIGNTIMVGKNSLEHRKQLQKFPLNLKLRYATGPRTEEGALFPIQTANDSLFTSRY